MATVRRRLYKNKQGKVIGYRWVVNYTDSNRKRHEMVCPKGWTKSQAQARRAQYELDPGGDPRRPFDTIAGEWLRFVATKIKPQSYKDYERKIRLHAIPHFGQQRIARITVGQVEDFLSGMLASGYGKKQVAGVRGRLHGLFAFAIRRGHCSRDPTIGLELNLSKKDHEVRAMTADQLRGFLRVAQEDAPDIYPLFLGMARTGMRVGEATALHQEDIDLRQSEIRVHRTWVGNVLQETAKTRAGNRTVDMSDQLREVLRGMSREWKEAKLKGLNPPELVFVNRYGRRWAKVDARFKVIAKATGLDGLGFTPHSFRHTCARLLLEAGKPLVYIQRLLGHESMAITNDLYGRWARISDKDAVNALDNGFHEMQGKLLDIE